MNKVYHEGSRENTLRNTDKVLTSPLAPPDSGRSMTQREF